MARRRTRNPKGDGTVGGAYYLDEHDEHVIDEVAECLRYQGFDAKVRKDFRHMKFMLTDAPPHTITWWVNQALAVREAAIRRRIRAARDAKAR